jgi:putative membrane protein insertion efficiency factor
VTEPKTEERPGVLAWLLIGLVRLYQYTLAWALGGHCRFQPSCSHYAVDCLRMHGAWRGALLSVRRVSRCHPFHPGGYDPPPPRSIV